jgi:hypothetical protein
MQIILLVLVGIYEAFQVLHFGFVGDVIELYDHLSNMGKVLFVTELTEFGDEKVEKFIQRIRGLITIYLGDCWRGFLYVYTRGHAKSTRYS